ncbi:accessory gene regulator B family protein [Herbivorax sp. ANBcel31]|uniref:accessory gene regulator ArgB-like protein n=1 Tax=Herbivorax sp. ANBcel31 TaxID=3069754 RepID=UPI0027B0EFA2|nr:accessory gene regulator B family protein [Herbivorax sp. ANBcel31]MDQ2087510.1 accessory gene regulator B family protein [Herbivorax sp. ANBcel31]
MRFIQAMSYRGADYLMRQKQENHEKRRVYYYGFQIVIGIIVKVILLILLALVTQTLKASVVTVLMFSSLRMLAGGYHMDSYGKCIGVSVGLFIIAGIISTHTYTIWSTYAIIALISITFIISIASIIKWAPSDNPNRPITDKKEFLKFKRLSVSYIILWAGAVLTAFYFNYNMYVLAASFGVLLEVFSITPLGYRFFDAIKNGFSKTKRQKTAH